LFLQRGKTIRTGVSPMRIEILTDIDGVPAFVRKWRECEKKIALALV
jgi:hypothetical protein